MICYDMMWCDKYVVKTHGHHEYSSVLQEGNKNLKKYPNY